MSSVGTQVLAGMEAADDALELPALVDDPEVSAALELPAALELAAALDADVAALEPAAALVVPGAEVLVPAELELQAVSASAPTRPAATARPNRERLLDPSNDWKFMFSRPFFEGGARVWIPAMVERTDGSPERTAGAGGRSRWIRCTAG